MHHGASWSPNISYLAFYLLTTVGYWSSNSKCATHWRFEGGEVIAVFGEEESIMNKDPLFRILTDHKPSSTQALDNVSVDVMPLHSGIPPGPQKIEENTRYV